MTLEEFEDIVLEVVSNLPKEFVEKLDNVGIVVEAWPTPAHIENISTRPGTLLFGLYRGVPKTQRGSYYSALPDKITIFAGPILSVASDVEDAKRRVRSTVLHEIGHHFGMSEDQIRRAEHRRVT